MYLIPKDRQLKDSMDFAQCNNFSIVASSDQEEASENFDIGGTCPEGSRGEISLTCCDMLFDMLIKREPTHQCCLVN